MNNNDISEQIESLSLSLSTIKSILIARNSSLTFENESKFDTTLYYPLTISEHEIQYFNITLIPPMRLSIDKVSSLLIISLYYYYYYYYYYLQDM